MFYAAFNSKISERSYFTERDNNMSTLRIAFSVTSSSIRDESSPRIQDLAELGALIMLMLLTGQYPHPLDPCIVQLLIHDCDVRCLHEEFVMQWHPSLATLIRAFIDIGHTGDLSQDSRFSTHFASYHDTEVSDQLAIRMQDWEY